MKKPSGDVTILHVYQKSRILPEIWSAIDRILCQVTFWPFIPLTTWKINFGKMKKRHEISFFFTCVPQTTIIWCMVPENGARQTEFLSFWASFCLFTPLTTQKTKILKKWKKRLDILSLYTRSRKSYNVWFLRHGARQTEFFLILDHFLPFCTLNNPKSQHFVKTKKRPGDMIILHKCTKNHDHMLYCA